MPRETINMTAEEIRAFGAAQRWAFLATLEPDGWPWAEAVPCACSDGRVYFALAEGSRSLANLRREGRACCILESSPSYYQIKGVIAHGQASEEAGPPASAGAKGAWFSLTLDRIATFDFAKIKRRNA